MVIKAPWKRDKRRANQVVRAWVRDLLLVNVEDRVRLGDLAWVRRRARRAQVGSAVKRDLFL